MANPCATCFYHSKCAGMVCCGYLNKTGHRRPCDPGEACTVRVPYRRGHYPRKKGAAANG